MSGKDRDSVKVKYRIGGGQDTHPIHNFTLCSFLSLLSLPRWFLALGMLAATTAQGQQVRKVPTGSCPFVVSVWLLLILLVLMDVLGSQST